MGKFEALKCEQGHEISFTGVIDSEGKFLFINSNFQKNLQSNVLEILHNRFFDFVHP